MSGVEGARKMPMETVCCCFTRRQRIGSFRRKHDLLNWAGKMDHLELFHNLVNLAASDGKFSEEEIQFLARRAERWEIPQEELESALAGIARGGHFEINLPDKLDDRVNLMKEMIRLMAVDGELADMEKHICSLASAKMDFTAQQFDEILQTVILEQQ